MSVWRDITNIWKNVREIDLRPIRQEAVYEVKIALVGEQGSGRRTLAEQLRRDPKRPGVIGHTPVIITEPDAEESLAETDLIIMMVPAMATALQRERNLARQWTRAGKKVVVFSNHPRGVIQQQTADVSVVWNAAHIFVGPADDPDYLLERFVPPILELLPDKHLSLGRHYPLFRVPIAHQLINDTSFSNAAYALSTGLAEMVPALGIPINITDMVVLTKAQAFLVYRLGLVIGFSTRWQDYVTEFGSVIGGGFMWRQLARSLVGLIPVVGVVPKVAVAYAGTFVVGHVVLRWYLTGRHVSPKQIREMYRQAFKQGKTIARNLLQKTPRPRLGRRKPLGRAGTAEQPSIDQRRLAPVNRPAGRVCAACGRANAADARYCQYCGEVLPGSPEEAVESA